MSLLHSKTDACQLVAGWKFIYGDANFRAMYLLKYPEVIYIVHSTQHSFPCDMIWSTICMRYMLYLVIPEIQ